MADNGDMTPWTLVDASAAVNIALDWHNIEVLKRYDAEAKGAPPADRMLALEVLARPD